MMKIKVVGYLTIKKIMGNRSSFEMKSEKPTLRKILSELCVEFKDLEGFIFDKERKDVNRHIRVFINGHHYSFLPNRMDTELKENDEISIFPPVAGG